MKKYISFFLIAVLCSSILAGCGGSGKSGSAGTVLPKQTIANKLPITAKNWQSGAFKPIRKAMASDSTIKSR